MKTHPRECRGSECANHHKERPRSGGCVLVGEVSAKHSPESVGKENGGLASACDGAREGQWEVSQHYRGKERRFRGPRAAEVLEAQQVGLTLRINV